MTNYIIALRQGHESAFVKRLKFQLEVIKIGDAERSVKALEPFWTVDGTTLAREGSRTSSRKSAAGSLLLAGRPQVTTIPDGAAWFTLRC